MDEQVDHAAVVKEGTAGDQKRLGTYKMHQRELQTHFRDLMEAGISDPRVFEQTLLDFLRQFETIRVSQERQIAKYEQSIAYCRARQRAASEHANLILAILTTQVDHAIKAKGAGGNGEHKPGEDPPAVKTVTDTELLKTICMCGCQDEEDAARCDCMCHVVGYCEDVRCAVCPEKKASQEKKPPRKKSTKKASRKKTTKKKGK